MGRQHTGSPGGSAALHAARSRSNPTERESGHQWQSVVARHRCLLAAWKECRSIDREPATCRNGDASIGEQRRPVWVPKITEDLACFAIQTRMPRERAFRLNADRPGEHNREGPSRNDGDEIVSTSVLERPTPLVDVLAES